ncbi:MAG: histidinol-phosphate transaminase, partial [Thermofilaceae archaeon]
MHLEPPSGVHRLSLNENLFLPKELILSITRRALELIDPRLYADVYGEGLAEKLAEFHDVDMREIIVGPGADYIIYLLASLGREGVVIVEPTFEEYERAACLFGAPVTKILLGEDFSLIPSRIRQASGRIVYMASPNNPTGNQYDKAAVEEVADSVESIIVVDEAYAEYGRYTLIHEAPSLNNLVVVRTFSKAWGLAGLRVGYAVTNAELAKKLKEKGRVFATSILSLKAAELMLDHWHEVSKAVEEAKLVRDWLIGEIAHIAKPYH